MKKFLLIVNLLLVCSFSSTLMSNNCNTRWSLLEKKTPGCNCEHVEQKIRTAKVCEEAAHLYSNSNRHKKTIHAYTECIMRSSPSKEDYYVNLAETLEKDLPFDAALMY